jgi:hypothetical protein
VKRIDAGGSELARIERRNDGHAFDADTALDEAGEGRWRAWAPSAFVALGRFVAAPTLDLTIHIRRPLPPADMTAEDHVLARFTSRLSVGGVWEEDGQLWSPSGALLAQSRQLALARELP